MAAIQPDLSLLFEPFALGKLALRNRIVMAPMTRKRSPGGVPTEEVVKYYQRRGQGGVALIFSEGTFIDHPSSQAHEGTAYANIPHFFGATALGGWQKVLHAIHHSGAKFIPQLWHVGEIRQLGMPPDPTMPGFGPRQIRKDNRVLVKAMDLEDVDQIVQSYARAAGQALEMGCDGVALHGAHGYLIDQFFWPKTNPRNDQYGGAMENRCRFACEVVAAIRQRVGVDFPIVFRFSQWKMNDYDAKIADNPLELETLLGHLIVAGVDMFDVSTRRFWEAAFDHSELSLAAWTRQLSGKPTIAVGSIGLDQPHHSKFFRDKATIDANVTNLDNVVEAMSRGDFDLASIGRAILADSQWVEKVRGGNIQVIRPFSRSDIEAYH